MILTAILACVGLLCGAQQAQQETTLQIHDIHDLVDPDSDQLTRMKIQRASDQESADLEQRVQEFRKERMDLIEAAVVEFIRPPLVAERDSLVIAAPGVIAMNAPAAQHRWLRRFLELQRDPIQAAQIEIQILRAAPALLDSAGFKGSSGIIDKKALALGEARLKEADEIERVSAPSLVVQSGVRANISTVSQISYIKDWELVVVEPGGVEIADPIIDVIEEGVSIDCSFLEVERETHALSLVFKSTQVERPIQTEEVRISSGKLGEREVGRPVVTNLSLRSKLLIKPEHTAFLRSPTSDKEEDLLILIQVSKVKAPGK